MSRQDGTCFQCDQQQTTYSSKFVCKHVSSCGLLQQYHMRTDWTCGFKGSSSENDGLPSIQPSELPSALPHPFLSCMSSEPTWSSYTTKSSVLDTVDMIRSIDASLASRTDVGSMMNESWLDCTSPR
mmetsp:Transcript_41973/g.110570  ORF Transcript_41973/g.110570 Transcript_41973/m.110570 type:complete len:127 (-) Transcript_41973:393-773(-)